jgi:hypothetical protein
MKNSFYRVVEDRPLLKTLYRLLFVLALLGVSSGGFFAGQRYAQKAIVENSELRVLLSEASESEKALRVRLVDAELSVETQNYAATALREELINMHSERAEMLEELGFFRNLMTSDDEAAGLRIGDLNILQGNEVNRYNFAVVVTQAAKVRRPVSGQVDLVVKGTFNGGKTEYSLAELNSEPPPPLNLTLHKIKELGGVVDLPEKFIND